MGRTYPRNPKNWLIDHLNERNDKSPNPKMPLEQRIAMARQVVEILGETSVPHGVRELAKQSMPDINQAE